MANRYIFHPIEPRFWPNVNKTEDCWVWTGSTLFWGYGSIRVNGRSRGAHRVSWELHYGPIPEGLWVLHHCDNPPCVRPDHLYLGTPADNVRDAVVRRRHSGSRKTHCPRGHPLSGANLYVPPSGRRYCRACQLARARTPESKAVKRASQRRRRARAS